MTVRFTIITINYERTINIINLSARELEEIEKYFNVENGELQNSTSTPRGNRFHVQHVYQGTSSHFEIF